MDRKMKIGLIAVVLGLVAVAFLASPIQAYMNGEADLLQSRDQERDRLRTQEQDCDGGALQAQTRDQFKMHAHGCDCDGIQKQNRLDPEDSANAANSFRNGTRDQLRYQHHEGLDA
jgi:hypothetical protein